MINRFRVAMTLVAASQVAITAGMAAATQLDYSVSPVVAITGVIVSTFLGVVATQMPSWQASPEVSRAATNAEKP